MSIKIIIANLNTKESREITEDGSWEKNEFIWTDGNNRCDCNRNIYFLGVYDEDKDVPCGRALYRIKVIEDGGIVYDEEEAKGY